MTDSALVERAWRDHRPYLVNLAYQMLGDIGDAEDAAQEAFLRLSSAESQHIDDVRAWLTVVTGRLCLDHVRSARARLERPDAGDAVRTTPAADADPADRITLDDQVRAALLTVLNRLSPAERVAFVLHDVFAVPFDEIAETVGRPVGTCRQLARRARTKFADSASRPAQIAATEHQLVIEKFITACANGDLQALTAVLDPTVWGVATFLGDPPPPPQINHGRELVAPNLLRFLAGGTLVGGSVGEPVVLAFANRQLVAVLVFTVREGRIVKIEATVDPSARTR